MPLSQILYLHFQQWGIFHDEATCIIFVSYSDLYNQSIYRTFNKYTRTDYRGIQLDKLNIV